MLQFMALQLFGLVLIVVFPEIALWLPRLIYGKQGPHRDHRIPETGEQDARERNCHRAHGGGRHAGYYVNTGNEADIDAAAAILGTAGVALVPFEFANDAAAAVAAAGRLGYPVALKIESRDIAHKTEAGGVLLGIADETALRAGFEQIAASARNRQAAARIDGVIVQKMVEQGAEMVIGVQQDAAFGPVLMVGFGGVMVEVMKDVAFAAAPLTLSEADTMLSGLKAARVLQGVRGRPPVDRIRLCEMLVNVSRLAAAAGPRLAELDLNPVMAGAEGAVAVNWLMVVNNDDESERG